MFGLPLMLAGQAGAAAQESFWASVLGVVLVPLVLPWEVLRRPADRGGDAG